MDDENLEDINLADLNLNVDNINLSDLKEEETNQVESNDILENADKLNLGITKEQVQEFYNYISGKTPRPVFAEKFFADGTSRLNEAGLLVSLMSTSFVPKLLAMQQCLVDSLSRLENFNFLSADEQMTYLKTLSDMSIKLTETSIKYINLTKDFTGVPLIYRQLLDQLLMLEADKLPRLKKIPELVEVSEEKWNRIIEIADIKE